MTPPADGPPEEAAGRVSAVIVAGGAGRRIGGEPKQFRPIGGRPLLEWSCATFTRHPDVERVVVVVPEDVVASPPGWLDDTGVRLAPGGPTRRASVRAGLEALAELATKADDDAEFGHAGVVLIHDAARPFASAELVGRIARAAREGPAIPVLPLADAIKQVGSWRGDDEAVVHETLDRSRLRAAQTPQGFPFRLILRLHREADSDERPPDDAALSERAGIRVRTVPGERWAWKITHPEDLAVAEWLVASGRITWPGEST